MNSSFVVDPKRINALIESTSTKQNTSNSATNESNKIRNILNSALREDNWDLTFMETTVDCMEELPDGTFDYCVSVRVRLLCKSSGVTHDNIGTGIGTGTNADEILKQCSSDAKINGIYRALQLFGITTGEYEEQYRGSRIQDFL
ncbi:Uncharacterized protein QTN25_006558 [Entamoeba marina]